MGRIRVGGPRALERNGFHVVPDDWDSVGDMEALTSEDMMILAEEAQSSAVNGKASVALEGDGGASGTSELPKAQEDPKEGQDAPVRVHGFTWSDVERFLHRVPPVEADYMRLRLDGLTQFQIAAIFGVTQAAVSYRLRTLAKRLRWLATVPELDPSRFQADLAWVMPNRHIAVMRALYECGSQSKTAERLYGKMKKNGVDWKHGHAMQGLVRSRMLAGLRALREVAANPDHPARERTAPYLAFFEDLITNRRWALASESRVAEHFSHVRTAEIIDAEDPRLRPGKSRR